MTSPTMPDCNGIPIEIGARVWARYSDDLWYAAYVLKREGTSYHVVYDSDGSQDTVAAGRLAVANIVRRVAGNYPNLGVPAVRETLLGKPISEIWVTRGSCVGFGLPLLWAMWHYVNEMVFANVLNPPVLAMNTSRPDALGLAKNLGGGRAKLMMAASVLSLHDLLDTVAHEMVHQWQFQELMHRRGVKIDDYHGETFYRWQPTILSRIGIRITTTGKMDDTVAFTPSKVKTRHPVYVALVYDPVMAGFHGAVVVDPTEARRLLTRTARNRKHALYKIWDSQVRQVTFPGKVGALRFVPVSRPFAAMIISEGEIQPGYLILKPDMQERPRR